jgi:hypothetical protein
MLTVKGLVLSLLVVSSAIPLFLMMPDASQALAQPGVTETITGLTDATDTAYDPVHERMYVTGGNSGNCAPCLPAAAAAAASPATATASSNPDCTRDAHNFSILGHLANKIILVEIVNTIITS